MLLFSKSHTEWLFFNSLGRYSGSLHMDVTQKCNGYFSLFFLILSFQRGLSTANLNLRGKYKGATWVCSNMLIIKFSWKTNAHSRDLWCVHLQHAVSFKLFLCFVVVNNCLTLCCLKTSMGVFTLAFLLMGQLSDLKKTKCKCCPCIWDGYQEMVWAIRTTYNTSRKYWVSKILKKVIGYFYSARMN